MSRGVHENILDFKTEQVEYRDITALSEGMAICHDLEFVSTSTGQTAADEFNRRLYIARKPSATYTEFLGVVNQAVPADSGRTAKWTYSHIADTDKKGAYVASITGVSLGAILGFVTADAETPANVGKFIETGLKGLGAVKALKTSTAGGLMPAMLFTGDGVTAAGVTRVTLPAIGGAVTTLSNKGINQIIGQTLSNDATYTLADGTEEGQEVVIKVTTEIVTNNLVVTVTNGLQQDDSTALATLTFDGASDEARLTWAAGSWRLKVLTGAVAA